MIIRITLGMSFVSIQPRKPVRPFDFASAIGLVFTTSDGKHFVIHLLLWMTVVMTIVYLIAWPMMLSDYGTLLEYNWENMQATLNGGAQPDPARMLTLMGKMAPAYAVLMLGMWCVLASAEAALHRKVLLEQGTLRRPLSFGKVELKIMLVQLCVWGLWFLVYIGGALLIGIVGGLLVALVAPLGVLVIVLGLFALLAFLVYLPVKFSPAAALTVSRNKIHIVSARAISKHRFWNLFLAYMMVMILGYVAISMIGTLCMFLATGSADAMMAIYGLSPDNPRLTFEATAERLKNPVFLAIAIIALVLYLAAFNLWYLCLAGIGTYAVKWWRDDLPSSSFD